MRHSEGTDSRILVDEIPIHKIFPIVYLNIIYPTYIAWKGEIEQELRIVHKLKLVLIGSFSAEFRWKIVSEFNKEEREKFLKFVTSCSRPPLLGFRKLHPKFCIQQIRISNDQDRLPIAATCMNLLKLPTYSSAAVMKEKLLFAIEEGQGFGLSWRRFFFSLPVQLGGVAAIHDM